MTNTVYEGNKPYIFVSYAHVDSVQVLPIIEKLQQKGFRVWYDRGIEAGTEWPEYIAEHLENAASVIVFMSEAAAASKNCRREINFSIEINKEPLVIYLEDVALTSGLKLQLNTLQAMFKNRSSNLDEFVGELCKAKIIKNCHENSEAYEPKQNFSETKPEEHIPPTPTPTKPLPPTQPIYPAAKPKKTGKKKHLLLLIPIILAVVAFLAFFVYQTISAEKNLSKQRELEQQYSDTVENESLHVMLTINQEDFTNNITIRYETGEIFANSEDIASISWINNNSSYDYGYLEFIPTDYFPVPTSDNILLKENDYRICSEMGLYIGEELVAKGYIDSEYGVMNASKTAIEKLYEMAANDTDFNTDIDRLLWSAGYSKIKNIAYTDKQGNTLPIGSIYSNINCYATADQAYLFFDLHTENLNAQYYFSNALNEGEFYIAISEDIILCVTPEAIQLYDDGEFVVFIEHELARDIAKTFELDPM